MSNCVDCNKTLIKRGAKRCKSCARKKVLLDVNKNPWYKDGRNNKISYCIDCNKKLSNYKYKRCIICSQQKENHNRYGVKCSKETKNKISLSQTKELHWNWQGGKSFEPYPLGWTKTFKEQIRYRDSYKCQLCNKPEIENNRRLDVHHIDYNKNNLDLNNLISLCKSCHIKTNHDREKWIKYFKNQKGINNGPNTEIKKSN